MRLRALLTDGPTVADDSFRRILRVDGTRVLCAKDAGDVELFEFGGANATTVFAVSAVGFPVGAVPDRTASPAYVLASGYAGSVRVP